MNRRRSEKTPQLTEAELFGQEFMEWKRKMIADLAKVDAIFKKHLGMTTDELWKHMQDAADRRKRSTKARPKRPG
jgi:hypothetical protein